MRTLGRFLAGLALAALLAAPALAQGVEGIDSTDSGCAGTVNGIVKGNGTGSCAAAAAGTDYAPATTGSAIQKANGAGGFANAAAGTDYQAPLVRGQLPGTATNDSAAAGDVGEVIASGGFASSATVTISIASPAVVTDGGAIPIGSVINFTNAGGALPTGITAGTDYYVIPTGFNSGVSYEISASAGGAAINTSGTQSGVQTRVHGALLPANGTLEDAAVASLTAGDWMCYAGALFTGNGATTKVEEILSTASGATTNQSLTGSLILPISATSPTVVLPGGVKRYQVATTQNAFLTVAVVAAGVSSAQGYIECHRAR